MTRIVSLAMLVLLPLLATGCAELDPYRREYMWQPAGTVDGNLAAQLVDPMDLVRGRGTTGSDGARDVDAIDKWNKAGTGAKATTVSSSTTSLGGS